MENLLKGKVAVVTGGNSGIGFETAKQMKAAGAKVVFTGRDPNRVKAAAIELGLEGIVADASSLQDTVRLVETIQKTYGKIDILFINAGVFSPTPVGQTSEEAFDQIMGINFKGAVFTVEKFLPILNDGGSIINLSSVNAHTGMPNTAIYSASKAAMNSFTRTAATELAPRRIRINSVNPGPIQTPIFGKAGFSEEELHGFAQTLQNRIPLKRFGTTEDVANLVVFLASDKASFMTGSEYNVDGGINVNTIIG